MAANIEELAYDDAFRDKTLRAYVKDGILTEIPAKVKKREVILDWLAGLFEAEREYPEKELSEIIERVNPDYCTLRRELVTTGRMTRDHGVYVKHEKA